MFIKIKLDDQTMFGLLKGALQDGVEVNQYVAAILKGVAEFELQDEPDDGGTDKIKADLEAEAEHKKTLEEAKALMTAEDLKRRQTIEVGDTVYIRKDNSHSLGRGRVGLVIENPFKGVTYPIHVRFGQEEYEKELYITDELMLLQKGDRTSGAVEGDRN